MENMTNNNTKIEYLLQVYIVTVWSNLFQTATFRGEPGEVLRDLLTRIASEIDKQYARKYPEEAGSKWHLTRSGYVTLAQEHFVHMKNHECGGEMSRMPIINGGWDYRTEEIPLELDEDYRLVPVTD